MLLILNELDIFCTFVSRVRCLYLILVHASKIVYIIVKGQLIPP